MKEALQNEEFYEGDNPLEQNDDDKGDNQDSDDDYSSEEDDDDTHWGKRGVSKERGCPIKLHTYSKLNPSFKSVVFRFEPPHEKTNNLICKNKDADQLQS